MRFERLSPDPSRALVNASLYSAEAGLPVDRRRTRHSPSARLRRRDDARGANPRSLPKEGAAYCAQQRLSQADVDDHAACGPLIEKKTRLRRTLRLGNDRIALDDNALGR